MVGIERGQREEGKLGDSGEWYKVSERSKRSMIGLTVLAALELGILDFDTENVHGSRKGRMSLYLEMVRWCAFG